MESRLGLASWKRGRSLGEKEKNMWTDRERADIKAVVGSGKVQTRWGLRGAVRPGALIILGKHRSGGGKMVG